MLLILRHGWHPGSTEKYPLDTLLGVYWESIGSLFGGAELNPNAGHTFVLALRRKRAVFGSAEEISDKFSYKKT
jgi:hypothetical protein